MISLVKNTFYFIFKYKKTLFFVVSLSLMFFMIRFPWGDLVEKSVKDFQKNSRLGNNIRFEDLNVQAFPLGVNFEKISVLYKAKSLELDSLVVSLDIIKLLALQKALKFKVIKNNSKLVLTFQEKTTKLSEEQNIDNQNPLSSYIIKGFSESLNLNILESLYPGLSGTVKTDFFYKGSLEDIENISADFNLTGQKVSISQLQLNTVLGPLSFPPMNWTNVEIELQAKEGELLFDKVVIGSLTDELKIKMKGSASFKIHYGRPRINSYNMELQIDMNKKISIGFLDLMFSGYKKDKTDFYRYSLRLIGQGSKVPRMEKLESFSF